MDSVMLGPRFLRGSPLLGDACADRANWIPPSPMRSNPPSTRTCRAGRIGGFHRRERRLRGHDGLTNNVLESDRNYVSNSSLIASVLQGLGSDELRPDTDSRRRRAGHLRLDTDSPEAGHRQSPAQGRGASQ